VPDPAPDLSPRTRLALRLHDLIAEAEAFPPEERAEFFREAAAIVDGAALELDEELQAAGLATAKAKAGRNAPLDFRNQTPRRSGGYDPFGDDDDGEDDLPPCPFD
jgi:hypothetical protein